MKKEIRVIKVFTYIFAVLALMTPTYASAQKFAVKAYGDIGLGGAMSMTTALPGITRKSSTNAFGVDFGYTFWHQGRSALEANIGIGYRMASASFVIPSLSFDYAAPASSDEDGNPYRRYTTLTDVNQKINLGYFNIPIYLQYRYRIAEWLGLHADVGFGLGFKCNNKVGLTSGVADTFGVYQEYDQLVIKAKYLNDFGETYLDEATEGKADIKGFNASVIAGVGLEFYIANPVSIDLGVRYNVGLTDVFTGHYDITSASGYSVESAPITYTVADGQQVKALSDYVTKSRLNPLSLHVGVNIRF